MHPKEISQRQIFVALSIVFVMEAVKLYVTLFSTNPDELINVQKYVNMKITLFHVIIPTYILSLTKKTDLLRENLVESEIKPRWIGMLSSYLV